MREQTDSDRTDCRDTNDDGPTEEASNDETPRTDESSGAADWTQVAQRHYDPHGTTELTTVVVSAIATAEGVAAREIRSPVLYEHVDIAAVAEVFFGPSVTERGHPNRGRVEFRYEGYWVVVASDGRIAVYERTDAAAADGPE